MKKCFILIVSCVIFIMFCCCHTPAERSAVSRCKNACKSPDSFRLKKIESQKIEEPAEWVNDTLYYYRGEERIHSRDKKNGICGYFVLKDDGYDLYRYYPKYVKYDSIAIIKVGHDSRTTIYISVDFTAENLFGVRLSNHELFCATDNNSKAYPVFDWVGMKDFDTIFISGEKFNKSKTVINTHSSGYYYL